MITDQDRGKWTSASNAEADRLCVGRHQKQEGLPETSSPDADSGTRIHYALFRRDPSHLSVDEYATYEKCIQIEEDAVEQFLTPEGARTAMVQREKRLWCDWGHVKHSGQPDVVHTRMDGSRAIIVEYKAGWDEVEAAPRNRQTRDHVALLAWNILSLDMVGTVIVQPHITMKPVICAYTANEIAKAYEEMKERVIESNLVVNKDKLTPGEVQCKFCRAKPICKPYNEWASASAPIAKYHHAVPVAEWTPEMMVAFLQQRNVAKKWLDDCYDYVKAYIKSHPGEVPGAGIKPGTIDRPVAPENIQELFGRAEKFAHVEIGEFMQCLEVSKGKLEKLIAAKAGVKGQSLANVMDVLYKGLTLERQKDGTVVLSKECPVEPS